MCETEIDNINGEKNSYVFVQNEICTRSQLFLVKSIKKFKDNSQCSLFPYDARAYSQHAANQNDSFKKKLDC